MSKQTKKERPIPFSGEMVRAILDGRKTQTRRVIKPQPHRIVTSHPPVIQIRETDSGLKSCKYSCPLGFPGSRLWVREAWKTDHIYDDIPPRDLDPGSPVLYLADEEATGIVPFGWGRYRHARFMPRWASRITLEIESISVERLQDISEEDALAEGIDRMELAGHPKLYRNYENKTRDEYLQILPKSSFLTLWESINGFGSWEENPWVWKISFTRIEP